MEKSSKKKTLNVFALIVAVVLALYVVSMVIPLFWTLMTTLKDSAEFGGGFKDGVKLEPNKLYWPEYGLTFDNYINAYKNFVYTVRPEDAAPGSKGIPYNITWQFINSLLYSVGCSVTITAASLVMAYAVARFNYRFSTWIYLFVLVALALPIVGSLPSELAVSRKLGLYDTFIGIWIMRGNFLNTYFLIFFAQFKMIPRDYTEAARIDGANPFTIMTQIIFPLASGTISTVFVLAFIGYWNDFQIPMVYLPSHPVAAFGMYYAQVGTDNKWDNIPFQMSAVVIMALPIIIFYGIFNKKMNVNLSVGGIKG